MVRKFKHHEQKLLKKVDFIQYSNEKNLNELKVMRRYHVQKRDDYVKYNRMCGMAARMAALLTKLDERDPFRSKMSEQLLEKLCALGIINTEKSLSLCSNISVASFCRRRLPVVMVRLKMAETVKQAVEMVEQGHVRVGPHTITDPAYLVTRNMEDFVTWVDTSKIRRHVMAYNDKLDDYDLL